jgi:beta-glucanase (GH16 family)
MFQPRTTTLGNSKTLWRFAKEFRQTLTAFADALPNDSWILPSFKMNWQWRQGSSLAAVFAVLSLFIARSNASGADLPAAVASPNGLPWVRTFSADFTSPTTTLNGWTKELGTGSQYGLVGWGNNELQSYTADSANLNISGGALNIVARVQNNGTTATSARINTQNLFSQTYGLFQFTARLPAGTALWPAIWMMPKNNTYGGWPTSGEIDVMESGLGHSAAPTSQVQGTFHSGPSYDQYQTDFFNTADDPTFNTTNLNTYDVLWMPGSDATKPATLKWYVNGKLYETRTGGWYNPPGASNASAPFDQPFYMIMNLAVGGPNTGYTGNLTPVDGTYTMQITDVEAFAFPTAGDFDRNGVVDRHDVTPMLDALANASTFAAAHNLTAAQLTLLGDINGDGKFTNSDIQPFLNKLAVQGSGSGALADVPEPASLTLLVLGGMALLRWKFAWARATAICNG